VRPRTHPLAVVTLIVGILAMLLAIWPWVGLGVAVVGVALFVVGRALKRSGRIAVAGLITSVIGAAGNVLVILAVLLIFPAIGSWIAHGGYDDNASENSRYTEDYDLSNDYLIDTPCFSFTGPEGWINHQSDYFDADCRASLEDHGPLDRTGRYDLDGHGQNIYSGISVKPVYGEHSLRSADIELDGIDASVERARNDDDTMDVVSIELVTPRTFSNYYGTFDALLITIEAPTSDIDAIVDELVDTWRWK
jgi:hypothetical protein